MKNILITGASKGVGLELVKFLLAKEEYCLFTISRTVTPGLQALLNEHGGRLKHLTYDLADTDSVSAKIIKEFIGFNTPLHGFVNNAAMAYDDIITNCNANQLKNMYDVNVFTPMIMVKYVIRHMLLHNIAGSIIHLSSISVHTGYKGLAMYASTKGALEAFSKNTAREWGEKGIRSNAIVAGFMETEMSAGLSAEQKSKIYQRTSLKKATSLQSLAASVEFLLSDGAASITGQNIFIDSGTI